jgi:adenylate cyclase
MLVANGGTERIAGVSTAYELIGSTGEEPVALAPGSALLVGRLATCAVPIYDGSISRDHATLTVSAQGVEVKDLGSTNGTFLNGVRVSEAVARDGDTLTFGGVSLRLRRVAERAETQLAASPEVYASKILRKLSVTSSPQSAAAMLGSGAPSGGFLSLVRAMPDDRPAAKLEVLLEVAKELARQQDLDALFRRIADLILAIGQVDRVCIMTVEGDTLELVPRVAKGRSGAAISPGMVPRALAYQAVAERMAILSEDLAKDERFDSESMRIERQRSAICVPLAGDASEVLGILYLDKLSVKQPLTEEDLELMTALGNLAAVAIENRQLQERGRRESESLEKLRRLLSPNLAAEIGALGEGALLGAAKRPTVLLVVEICDFAARAERLPAAEIAEIVNAYCGRVVETIFQYGGTLDHVVGHTVIALWGSPVGRPDDADRALRAAQEMRAGVEELNAGWVKRGRARIDLGVGIAYGEVFVGNVGARQRSDYTVIGRAAELAATLARAAKRGEILVSEAFVGVLGSPPRTERAKVDGVDGKILRLV